MTRRPARRPGDDDLAGFQRAMWHDFAGNLPLLPHQIASTTGREMRASRLDQSRVLLADYIERQGIDPHTAEGQRLISLLLLINGSLALIELHDRQGLDVDEALEHSLWAMRALSDATGQEPPATEVNR